MIVTRLLIARNLRLFIRDRLGVFFSLLSALILIGLYALFLGQNQIDALAKSFPDATAAEVRSFIYAWVVAGVVMITTLTVSFSTVGAFVDDRASGRFQDFLVSPVRRISLVLGYLLSGAIVSIVVTVVIVIGGEIVLVSGGAALLTPAQAATCLAWIVLSAVAFSALSSFLVSFLRSQGALSALGTIVGTVIGFLAGAYIPVGVLPEGAQRVIAVLPFAQSAMLIRRPLTETPLADLAAGSARAADSVRDTYGVALFLGSREITPLIAALELGAVAVVFTALAVVRLARGIR